MKNISKLLLTTMTIVTLGSGILMPAVSAAALGERTLSSGSRGEDVRQLQVALNKAGYHAGAADGVYGAATEQAVRKVEKANRIQADGVADQGVVTALTGKTKEVPKADGAPANAKQVLDVVATAYAPGPHDNGKWGNKTHLGTNIRPGVIAVDPRVIPLGTRVYIEFADGHGSYANAEDTGGAIKGNRIDIAMTSVAEAYDFGMQKVKVYVLD
ncbi:MAG TPA: 3D domain-containing protein [Selenomonadales bacterium]|nr:3D domain-containing protein [Selenomonadales bacterium]